jgi:hypothetical protein
VWDQANSTSVFAHLSPLAPNLVRLVLSPFLKWKSGGSDFLQRCVQVRQLAMDSWDVECFEHLLSSLKCWTLDALSYHSDVVSLLNILNSKDIAGSKDLQVLRLPVSSNRSRWSEVEKVCKDGKIRLELPTDSKNVWDGESTCILSATQLIHILRRLSN